MYVRVAVNIPQVSGEFDYALPEALKGQVKPGCLLVVPFGRQSVQAVVLREVEIPAVAETREALELVDPEPVLTPAQLALAAEIAHQNLAPLAQCLDLMIPSGLSQHADTIYSLHPCPPTGAASTGPVQQRILALLAERGPLRGRQLENAFPRVDWKNAAQRLVRSGLLSSRAVLPPPSARVKTVRTVQLAVTPEQIEQRWETLGKGAALERRQNVLRFLLREPWAVDAPWVYAQSGAKLGDLQKLAEMGLVILGESEAWRDPLEGQQAFSAVVPKLTPAQLAAWEQIYAGITTSTGTNVRPFLLYGVTGSGKTELYLRAVAEIIARGKQAVVLVPEISLTPQTVRRFLARFPGQVGLIHSRLSAGEQYDTWRRARAGQLAVIVGPRSALFAPLPDIGLIVVDECHDGSYFQSEPPVFHAASAAEAYGRLTGAVTIFGSATPPVTLMHRARQERWTILDLPERAPVPAPGVPDEGADTPVSCEALPLAPVQIIDMRQELKSGSRSIFSRALQQALGEVLAAQQQAILFLNRRGTATYVFCRDCGYTLRCPRCDLPLTFHESGKALRCHSCSYERNMPTRCPACGSAHIRQYGMGTEKVEADLQALFPEARILRWDAETTRRKDSHELLLAQFSHHHADILVGTQMLAKGLDLPLVTLVGVVLADPGLNFPDFLAGERAFQLLTQVAGRAGRSALGGRVILQTFQPEHYIIQAAAAQDYPAFYRRELEERRRLGYPPFTHMLRLEVRHPDARQAEQNARRLAGQIKYWLEEGDHRASEMIGPAPCFFSRANGLYRWQIVLRGPDPASILRGRPLAEARIEIDPPRYL